MKGHKRYSSYQHRNVHQINTQSQPPEGATSNESNVSCHECLTLILSLADVVDGSFCGSNLKDRFTETTSRTVWCRRDNIDIQQQ